MIEKEYQLSLVDDVKLARISRADDFSPLSPIRCGTKILNLKTKEIGLLICIWKNKFADGEVNCLGFLQRSQSFAFSTSCKSAQSVRYPSFTRTEIRFTTYVDKQGKIYNIELDNIRGFEDDFEK